MLNVNNIISLVLVVGIHNITKCRPYHSVAISYHKVPAGATCVVKRRSD